MRTSRRRVPTLVSAGLAIAVLVSGCGVVPPGMWGMGSGGSPNDNAIPSANHADVAFVMMMIPHHQDAVDMVEVLLRKSAIDDEVATLARDISEVQTSEIQLMRSWLDDWGMRGGMNDHGGMMSDNDIDELEDATGADANLVFLTQMIEHHEDAIRMAEAELNTGESADVLRLASRIIIDQTEEIAAMEGMLERLR